MSSDPEPQKKDLLLDELDEKFAAFQAFKDPSSPQVATKLPFGASCMSCTGPSCAGNINVVASVHTRPVASSGTAR